MSTVTTPQFTTPEEVVALIGREGEPALLTQAEQVIALVSEEVNEFFGPWGEATDVTTTVRGTTSAALYPGVTFSEITSIEDVRTGVTLASSDYTLHGPIVFRSGGWGGPTSLFTISGNVDRPPSPAVCAVVKAVCARMLLNPAQSKSESVEGTSVSATVGLTVYEQRVLTRWRLTSTWPRGNP